MSQTLRKAASTMRGDFKNSAVVFMAVLSSFFYESLVVVPQRSVSNDLYISRDCNSLQYQVFASATTAARSASLDLRHCLRRLDDMLLALTGTYVYICSRIAIVITLACPHSIRWGSICPLPRS